MPLEPRPPFIDRARFKAAKVTAKRLARVKQSAPDRPVFLVGCARSGTTLLERLLAMHPDVSDWSEANEVWDPAWFPWTLASLSRPPVEFDPDAYSSGWEKSNLLRMDEIKSVFGHFQALARRPVFLNKTPYHSFRIHHLIHHFPDAKLIYIRRDGRAVVNSYMTKLVNQGKLKEWPEERQEAFRTDPELFARWLARYWEQTCTEAETRDEDLGLSETGAMLSLTYEALCADTRGVLDSVCEFIGIDPGRFDPVVWSQAIRNSNHKWKRELSPEVQRAILDEIDPALKKYGYIEG